CFGNASKVFRILDLETSSVQRQSIFTKERNISEVTSRLYDINFKKRQTLSKSFESFSSKQFNKNHGKDFYRILLSNCSGVQRGK
ncbi:hypothetical protein Bhyg_03470, partial [Pseudolycoriella hygida]